MGYRETYEAWLREELDPDTRAELAAYAAALSLIFERPVKETLLYFFDCDAAVHPE